MKRFTVIVGMLVVASLVAGPAWAQPANDDLASATDVTGVPFAEVVDTVDATVEPGEPAEGDESCPPRASTVWYAFTTEAEMTVSVDTAGSDYDTTLAVYTGTGYDDLSLVGCSDDTVLGLQAALTFDAVAGVTFLVQVGAFGEEPGGSLEISFDEPAKGTGKPLIFKSQFRGAIAEAYVDGYDETTGTFTSAGATIVDGQAHEEGKPSRFSTLFVSQYSETFDEATETVVFTEWSGSADLGHSDFVIDRQLRSAWVTTEVLLSGISCTSGFEQYEEPECVGLGEVLAEADIAWQGVGGIQKSHYKEHSSSDGTRFLFRGRFSGRDADVAGAVSGDGITIDLGGAWGSLSRQSSGEFIMIRGTG